MESGGPQRATEQFSSPEQELAFLRGQVAQKERELQERGERPLQERVIQEKIVEYQAQPVEKVLHPDYRTPAHVSEAIVLDLVPESHDEKISELLGILQEKGIKNALEVLERLKNPHLEDDFHRFLIQYVKAGHPLAGTNPKESFARSLKMTLYEISLPEKSDKDGQQQKGLKELISSMEQFYSGMLSVADEDDTAPNHFTLELAVSNHSDEFVFYAAVPDTKKNLFEKQILSIFHDARVVEKKDDYNIFNGEGASAGSIASLAKSLALPIKLYDRFDHDPLNVILNSFSKIKRDGEGAAIQIVFAPTGDLYIKKFQDALSRIQKGENIKDALDIPDSFSSHFSKVLKGFTSSPAKKDAAVSVPQANALVAEEVKRKVDSPIVLTNIRLVTSAATEDLALRILDDIQSAFNQFDNTQGNKLTFEVQKKGALQSMLRDFSFRNFREADRIPLSLRELTTVMHLPATVIKSAPQLKISKAGTAPVALDLPQQGLLLGVNSHRNIETKVFMQPEDRLRHFYCIGQTGTGKTSLLKNMILQDIRNGEGVCFIDPHGSDVQDILAKIPKERYEDVIYFDPAYTARPMALNMLEYDARFPEQKTFVVNEMLSIFNKLFDMKVAGGPMFEQYFRNAVLLTIDNPESGGTLLDVAKVLSVKAFREHKLSLCTNPVVIQFWKEVAEKAGGESSLANIVPYVVSKFDTFLANDIMRPVIAQQSSSFNFREIMDSKKILLVNLSKGRLGDINANLIGLILVGKILMAALSRVDSLGKELPPFYLYIDEFQNITTDSISVILSEARKYKLSLNIAHQFIAQLQEGIKNSVFGNVGSMAAFRVGSEDAEFLEKQFIPVFTARDIMNVDNYNAYVKMLSGGKPIKSFSMRLVPPEKGNPQQVESLKQLSYLKFGRQRSEIEAEIMKKYEKKPAVTPV